MLGVSTPQTRSLSDTLISERRHISHRHDPSIDTLVERVSILEHISHIIDLPLVERCGMIEHITHNTHLSHGPPTDVVTQSLRCHAWDGVMVQSSILPS